MSKKGHEVMLNNLIKSGIVMVTALAAPVYAGSHGNNGPISQQQFCNIISDYRTDYEKATSSNNEIRINNVLKKRSDELDALLPDGDFKDWEVEFLKATSSSTGGANVCMYIKSCDVILQTGTLKENLSERADYSVQYDTREYRAVSNLGRGDRALLSGKLTKIAKYQDGAEEYSYRKESLSDESKRLASNCELDLKASLLENKQLKSDTESLSGSVFKPQFFFFEIGYVAPIK